MFQKKTSLFSRQKDRLESPMRLEDGSRVAVIGGGPAGSFFSYFLLDMAERAGVDLSVDIYEPRDFSLPAPKGCNMCAGVISETLVQNLATEGIHLPVTVIQKAIDTYVLHTDVGSQKITAASLEKRIAATYRGAGPRDVQEIRPHSLDLYLLSLAESKGANTIRARVTGVEKIDDRLLINTQKQLSNGYDLVVAAAGVNTAVLKLFEEEAPEYKPPETTKTAIREYYLGRDVVNKHFGDSLHVFLLDIPRLDAVMIVPKGEYVSVCFLGKEVDDDLIKTAANAPEVKGSFPDEWRWDQPNCLCSPRVNVRAAIRPYADRIVFIGDSGVTRYYKDGIGSAYRAAKAAATCAVFQGISAEDFRQYYAPFCRTLDRDNQYGRFIFFVTHIIQKLRFFRRAMLKMVADEQKTTGVPQRMSSVLWDTFTGSAPYRDVFLCFLNPAFITRLAWSLISTSARYELVRRQVWNSVD